MRARIVYENRPIQPHWQAVWEQYNVIEHTAGPINMTSEQRDTWFHTIFSNGANDPRTHARSPWPDVYSRIVTKYAWFVHFESMDELELYLRDTGDSLYYQKPGDRNFAYNGSSADSEYILYRDG